MFWFFLAHRMEVPQISSAAVHQAVLAESSRVHRSTQQLSDQQRCLETVHTGSAAA